MAWVAGRVLGLVGVQNVAMSYMRMVDGVLVLYGGSLFD